MGTEVKEVPVEAHNSIGKVERYYTPLRRLYKILQEELKDQELSKELILQMAVKAVNDTAGLDGLVPTLLVFGAYPRMTSTSAPSAAMTARAEAIRTAMKEVRKLYMQNIRLEMH
jgi:di/tripeptidase